jgi:hypothetical protein
MSLEATAPVTLATLLTPSQNAEPSVTFESGQPDFFVIFDTLLAQLRFQFIFGYLAQVLWNYSAVTNKREARGIR